MNFFLLPGMPYFAAAVAAAMMAGMGLVMMERRQQAAAGMHLLPTMTGMSGRYLVGNLTGAPIAFVLILIVFAGNIQGQPRMLMLAGAAAVYLYLGMVIPRRPIVQAQKEGAQIRRLTPGFISFVRVGLGSFESPMDIMRRYTSRPVSQWAVMQTLVAEALQVGTNERMRPFAALAFVARQRMCRELVDVTEALAQAEAEGGRIDTVLAAQQDTLELILQSEFKRMIRRRTMYLLLMVAISLVVGILINLLWTMTGGGSVLGQLNG